MNTLKELNELLKNGILVDIQHGPLNAFYLIEIESEKYKKAVIQVDRRTLEITDSRSVFISGIQRGCLMALTKNKKIIHITCMDDPNTEKFNMDRFFSINPQWFLPLK